MEPSSHHSHHSYRAKFSMSGSMAGSVFSARLKGEQRKAELLIKAESLKKKKHFEEAKLHLKHEEGDLELEHKMKIIDAKNEVVDHFEKMCDGWQSLMYQPHVVYHLQSFVNFARSHRVMY